MSIKKIYTWTCMIVAFLFLFAAILNDNIKAINISTNSLLMMILAAMFISESIKSDESTK